MRNTLFFILILLHVCTINAQSKYFEQVAAWNSNQDGKKIKAINDSLFVISGNTVNPPISSEWHSYAVKWSLNGELSNHKEYPNAHNDISDLVNNQLAFTGYFYPDDSTSTYLYILNENGDSVSFKNVGTNQFSNWGRCIWADTDGSFVIGGTAYINEHKELYCLKVSADGTILWQYIDTTYTRTNYFTDILPDGTGGYYLYGSVNQYAYGLVATGDLLLLHLNANGQMIDQHTYSIGETDYSGYLIRSNDGNLLLGMAHGGEDNFVHGKALKINPNNHQIIWQSPILYIDDAVNTLIELPDGSIITTGTTRYPTTNSPGQMSLVKITADGDPMWSRQYGGQWNDYGYDVALSPDGGFVAVGRKDSAVVQTAFLYIVKTNCMGLLTEPQANFTYTSTALTASFQNLSQFVYPDSIDGGHYIWDFGDGTTSTQINPTHTYTQGANYTVTLTAVVCSDTSVFVQNVSTWAVGIEASPLPPPKEGEMQVLPLEGGLEGGLYTVLPNPAQDYLVISSQTSATNATFVLYDVLGREQLRQNLSSPSFGGDKGEATITTKHLPSGIYLYQIINPQNQTLQHGKLSILH